MEKRSFMWLPKNIDRPPLKFRRKFYECTRYFGHTLERTDVEGIIEPTEGCFLWVCPHCEPKKDGKWLAEVEQIAEIEKEKERNELKKQMRREAKAKMTNHNQN